MRVCLVSREVSPLFGAGIGVYVSAMLRAWASSGHDVHLLTDRHAGLGSPEDVRFPRVRVHTVDVAGTPPAPFWPERYALAVRRALKDLQARHNFEYIEFPDYDAEAYFVLDARRMNTFPREPLIALRLHTPTLECMRLNDEDVHDSLRARGIELEEACFPQADLLLSPTRSLLDIVTERIVSTGRTAPPAAVVPYPFTPDWAGVGHEAPEIHAAARVLYFGRLERRKGVDLLARAALDLIDSGEDLRFRFIGGDTNTSPSGGSMLKHLQRQTKGKHRKSFSFEPARPRHELARAIRGCEVCCFPSRWENFPNACLEAMSLGALVVGSDAGGMAEIIEPDVSGLLFQSGSVDSLASALRTAIRDDALRQQVRHTAPARIAQLCDPGRVVGQSLQAISHARQVHLDLAAARAGKPRA